MGSVEQTITSKMPLAKVTDNAWPSFMQDDDFDWSEEVIEDFDPLPEIESSVVSSPIPNGCRGVLTSLQESLSPLPASETSSTESSSTQNTELDDDFDNNPYLFEDLDAIINPPDTKLPLPTTPSVEFSDTYKIDVSFFLTIILVLYQCYAIYQLQRQPLVEPLIEMLEAWALGDSEIVNTNKEDNLNTSPIEFQISNLDHYRELTKDCKDLEDITSSPTTEVIIFGDESIKPTENNRRQNFSAALEAYLTNKPRASLPHHCWDLDLREEPVREPMPSRPLGVRQKKMHRYRDQKLTMGHTNMSTIGFKKWMELKKEGIVVEEITVTESEKKLMRDRTAGYYRCRPSDLRRCWKFCSSE